MHDGVGYLKQQLKEKQADREHRQAQEQDAHDRQRAIADAPPHKLEDFWCDTCQVDFSAPALKRVNWIFDIDHNRLEAPKEWRGWYEGNCERGHLALRRITDKVFDPYYLRSQWVKRQRIDHADDFLTPEDYRFRLKYPAQWRKLQESHARRLQN